MNAVRARLRAGDPLHEEPELSPEDVEGLRDRLRQITLPVRRPLWTAQRMWIALACVASLGLWLHPWVTQRWTSAWPSPSVNGLGDPTLVDTGRRQLQFVTPGGTQVIWVMDVRVQSK